MPMYDTYIPTRTGMTVETFKKAFLDNLHYIQGKNRAFASPYDNYMALAYTVRDRMMHRWMATGETRIKANPKTVYYLSAEYLMGRQLGKNLMHADGADIARQALAELDLDLDEILETEPEPGLGNGGLGRLAACFLDSLATLNIPNVGYGIRYEFGIFKQSFKKGWQVESPDNWLSIGNPWDFADPDDQVEVKFGGFTETYTDQEGQYRVRWNAERTVLGMPYNTMVPGYDTNMVTTLRLWQAKASEEFSLTEFDAGNYDRAVDAKNYSENISKVLYPNDNTPQGKQLRLEQQYFFVACSLRDIIRRYQLSNTNWADFPNKVTIQLNDTHPTVAIAELMRLLIDEYSLTWDEAWEITTKTFASTQHTILPESLEQWSVNLFGSLLPRHLDIIYEINRRFLQQVRMRFPNEPERVARMSLIDEGAERKIRMAHLACVGSYSINGVAALQSELLKSLVFNDFYEMWPHKFNNKTNGVTPRRFIKLANPELSDFISEKIGDGWVTDLDQFKKLEKYAGDAKFQKRWREIKQSNKQRLADYIQEHHEVTIDTNSIFDIMVKRLHEYKRQLLKALHIITLYSRLKIDSDYDVQPRTFIFGAKAAPGYYMAKLIIKLINSIAEIVNNDPQVDNQLKIVFLENFNVSLGERIYPAADLSEQISLAGKEASGTGNMKFALNGALTIGTLDGANVEIRELVGADNFFLFGLSTPEVFDMKAKGYIPWDYYQDNPELKRVIDLIASGFFSEGDQQLFKPIVDSLLHHDEYMLLADYQAYIDCQDQVDATYRDTKEWTRMSILNTARCGFFSSDRSMSQYCDEIWQVKPIEVDLEPDTFFEEHYSKQSE